MYKTQKRDTGLTPWHAFVIALMYEYSCQTMDSYLNSRQEHTPLNILIQNEKFRNLIIIFKAEIS